MFAGSILQSLREINRSLGEDVLTVHFDKESPGDKDHSTTVVSVRVCVSCLMSLLHDKSHNSIFGKSSQLSEIHYSLCTA